MSVAAQKISDLRAGLSGTAEVIVSEVHTARSMGSGKMPVLATPALVALMEAAAQHAIASCLSPGEQSVGTRLDIRHDGATPVGMKVIATAELTGVAGRELTFRVSARDEREEIGAGVHVRMVSSEAAFNRLLRQKKRGAESEIPSIKLAGGS